MKHAEHVLLGGLLGSLLACSHAAIPERALVWRDLVPPTSEATSGEWPERDWTIFMEGAKREFREGHFDESYQSLQVALSLGHEMEFGSPRPGLTHYALALTCERLKLFAEAQRHYTHALDILKRTLGADSAAAQHCYRDYRDFQERVRRRSIRREEL